MQARVKWVEGLTFLGESASGHQILMDGNSGDKADRKSTRLNSSHIPLSRMPSSA